MVDPARCPVAASAARWGSKVSYWLSRWGAWAARTRRPSTQRQLFLNACERLRLVATEAPRFCLTATRQTAVFAREFARGSTTREAEASPGVGPDE